VISVSETTITEVQADPPTVTLAPSRKPVPVRVISVPPDASPLEGLTESIVGAGSDVPPLVEPLVDPDVEPVVDPSVVPSHLTDPL